MIEKRKILVFMGLSFLLWSICSANGLNLNSLGSRALAMGGAFVGLADDFSALHWNPAGIAQFDSFYFGFYGVDIIPSGEYKMDIPTIIGPITLVDAQTQRMNYLAGMGAFYFPLSNNLVAGVGIYVPSGLGSKWDGEDFKLLSMNKTYEWESRIGMVTIAPALALKLSEKLLLGASLNINYAQFKVKTHAGSEDLGIDIGQYEESLSGWGYGATLGILLKPNDMLSLGGTLRTSSTISFSGDISISKINILSMIPGTPLYGANIPTTSSVEREVTWPMWLAGGIALKPFKELTITADAQWTQWSKIDVFKTEYEDPIWNLLIDKERPMHWDDVLQIRVGAEYRINNFAVRGGYYWDPSPAPDKTMNVLLPNYDFNVFTAGIGYNLDGLQIDIGFEYLKGKDRDIQFEKKLTDPEYETAMPGIYKMVMIVPNISIGYRF